MWPFRKFREPVDEVQLRPDGFSLVRDGEPQFDVAWDAIRGIAAFKEDLFTIDRICLAFRVGTHLDYPSVPEDAVGYRQLVKEIEERFQVCSEDWWDKVALPAVECCWTVLWGEAPEPIRCPDCGYDLRGTTEDRCPECGKRLGPDVCPDCGGRGYFEFRTFLWTGCAGVAVGIVWYLVFGLIWHTFLAGIGMIFVVLGVVAVVVNLMELRTACPRCNGTGRPGYPDNP